MENNESKKRKLPELCAPVSTHTNQPPYQPVVKDLDLSSAEKRMKDVEVEEPIFDIDNTYFY